MVKAVRRFWTAVWLSWGGAVLFAPLIISQAFLVAASSEAAAQTTHQTSSTSLASQVHTTTLENGLRVVAIPLNLGPVVYHQVVYSVGARHELPGKSGLAHLLEHMMFFGTSTYPKGEFTRAVDRVGGAENAATSHDATNYWQRVPADQLEMVMSYEADRMINLTFTDEQFEPEKKVTQEERRRSVENEPLWLLLEQGWTSFFPNSNYGRPVLGWMHEVFDLTAEDARQWYHDWYAPNNAILVVSGATTPKEVFALAQKTYGKIPAREIPEKLAPLDPPLSGAKRFTLADKRVSLPRVGLWYRLNERQLDGTHWPGGLKPTEVSDALSVFATAFADEAPNPLHDALVEEQDLANWVSVANWEGAGYTILGLSAEVKRPEDVETLISAIRQELFNQLADGFSEKEIASAIKRLQRANAFERDSLTDLADYVAFELNAGLPLEDVLSYPARLSNVDNEMIWRAFSRGVDPQKELVMVLMPEAEPEDDVKPDSKGDQ